MVTRSSLLLIGASVCLLAAVVLLIAMPRERPTPRPEVVTSPRSVSVPAEQAGSDRSSVMRVEVTGAEFAWHYRYPGPDEEFKTQDDTVVVDELRLPVDREVLLLVKSADFVYVYSVPQLNLRRIAVPELTYELRFRPADCGSFDVVTEPFCSVRLFHDEDMGRVVVQPCAEFDDWIEHAR